MRAMREQIKAVENLRKAAERGVSLYGVFSDAGMARNRM